MTEKLGLTKDDLLVIIQAISNIPDITKAVIFGSRAKGTYKAGSDIDIAIWVNDNDDVLKLSGMLNDKTLLPYKFDILDYTAINNVALKEHIDRLGIKIYPSS